jgi:high-affinity Fe2+/Pb2+ permease
MKKLFSALIIAGLIWGMTLIILFGKLNIAENLICFGVILILAIAEIIIIQIFNKELDRENKK